MHNRIKKISALTFLTAAVMPVLCTLFFLCKQQWVRYEMKEKLEKERLHTIVVAETAVEWVKYKKEIRIENRLFDIESFERKGNQFIFTGLFDEEETELNNYLKENFDQNNSEDDLMLSGFLKMLQSEYTVHTNYTLMADGTSASWRPLILQHTPSPFRTILTPPPQVLITYQA